MDRIRRKTGVTFYFQSMLFSGTGIFIFELNFIKKYEWLIFRVYGDQPSYNIILYHFLDRRVFIPET